MLVFDEFIYFLLFIFFFFSDSVGVIRATKIGGGRICLAGKELIQKGMGTCVDKKE